MKTLHAFLIVFLLVPTISVGESQFDLGGGNKVSNTMFQLPASAGIEPATGTGGPIGNKTTGRIFTEAAIARMIWYRMSAAASMYADYEDGGFISSNGLVDNVRRIPSGFGAGYSATGFGTFGKPWGNLLGFNSGGRSLVVGNIPGFDVAFIEFTDAAYGPSQPSNMILVGKSFGPADSADGPFDLGHKSFYAGGGPLRGGQWGNVYSRNFSAGDRFSTVLSSELSLPVSIQAPKGSVRVVLEASGRRKGWGSGNPEPIILGASATTFDPTDKVSAVILTGDVGGNTLASVEGSGYATGDRLEITVAALGGGITLTDTASPASNQMALTASHVMTIDAVVELRRSAGGYWQQVSASIN